MAICKYTGTEFTPRRDQPRWTEIHPAIKDATNAILDRHADSRYRYLYDSSIDRALAAAAPFALEDLPRVMADAERDGSAREREVLEYYGEDA